MILALPPEADIQAVQEVETVRRAVISSPELEFVSCATNSPITDLPGIGFEGKSDLYKEMRALSS